MRSKVLTHIQLLLVIAISAILLTKSHMIPGVVAPLADSEEQQVIHVITTRSIHNHHENGDSFDGLAYQLVKLFSEQNRYKLNIIIAEHSDDIFQAIDNNMADIALLDSPMSFTRQAKQPQSMAYLQTSTELIYRHGTGTPSTFEELSGKTVVINNSEHLREKQAYIQEHYPDIHWEFSSLSNNELLAMLNQGTIEYTLIDSHEFVSLRAIYTRTRSAFPIYYPEPISFALSDAASTLLLEPLNQFLTELKENGSLQHMTERYYGHSADSNPRGSHTFFARVNHRLPKYLPLIKTVAKEYQIDWRLLAAIAYQESHWDPLAKSPTGVRGMMMLTLQTAYELGVSDRLNTEQSLRGGATYLKSLMLRLPDEIQEPDRTWFALASYNVGIGHLMDALEITEFHGGNKYRWADVKKYLPLLENPEWHQFTRYGKARGNEPVAYVQNIRHFTDLLTWRFPNEGVTNSSPNAEIVRTFTDVLNDSELKKFDPEYGPVRLSNLLSGEDIVQNL